MSKLGGIKCRKALNAILSFGYEIKRQKGSHVALRGDGLVPLTFPNHPSQDINAYTLRGILKDAKIEEDEFLERL